MAGPVVQLLILPVHKHAGAQRGTAASTHKAARVVALAPSLDRLPQAPEAWQALPTPRTGVVQVWPLGRLPVGTGLGVAVSVGEPSCSRLGGLWGDLAVEGGLQGASQGLVICCVWGRRTGGHMSRWWAGWMAGEAVL